MIYVNKKTGARISSSVYSQLNSVERSGYVADYNSYESPRSPSSGNMITSAVVGYATDSALLGGLIGGDITGGILGDILDGDLMD